MTDTPTPVRVLILEDNPDDAELLVRELRRAHFDPDWRLVATEQDYLAQLNPTLNVILSDFSMPGFSGLRALQLLRERGLDIPFILISGTVGEDVAVEAIQAGAADYLLKDRLGRLGPAISRALENKRIRNEKRRADHQLQRMEKQLANILEHAAESIIAVNERHQILVFNKAAEKTFEYSAKEVLGQPLDVLIPDRMTKAHREHVQRFATWTDESRPIEHRQGLVAKRKDGSEFPVEIGLSKLSVDSEVIFTAMIVDITARKRAEETVQQMQQLFKALTENAPDGIALIDRDGHLKLVSPAGRKMFGYEREEDPDINPAEHIYPDDLPVVLTTLSELIEHPAQNPTLQYRFRHKDSSWLWIESTFTNLLTVKNVEAIVINFRDVTERRQSERALLASERRYLALFEDTPIAIWEEDFSGIKRHLEQLKEEGVTDFREYFTTHRQVVYECIAMMRILDINKATLQLYQAESKEALLKGMPQLFSKGEWKNYYEDLICIAEGRTGNSWEGPDETLTGKPIEISLKWSVAPGHEEDFSKVIVTTIDITERKRAEEKLLASEVRYRRLFESAKDGILILNAYSGEIVDVNPFLIEMLGYSHAEFLGRQLWEIGLFKDIVANKESFRELQEAGYIRYENLPLETKEGRRIWVEFVSNVYDVGGGQVVQCNIRDITERKQAEEKVQHQLEHLNSLRTIDSAISSSFDIHATLDIVLQQVLSQLSVDAAGILLVNSQTQMMEYAASRGFRTNVLHYTQLQLSEGYAGRAVHERKTIYIPALLEASGKLAEVMKSAGENFVDYYGTPLISKDGIRGVLEIYHRSALHPDPEWLHFLETLAGQASIAIDNAQLFDGLQRANAELEQRVAKRTSELNQTNIELEHANRTKDEFLATMSHELRTPLNSILGLSETLLEQRRDPLSEHQQKSLQTIASSGEHLLELINDILDLSKIEAGKFDYYLQLIGVDDLCRSSLTFVKEQVTRKSITLRYQLETTVSKMYADPRRLKQILVNLLTNAVKFTPNNGQVTLQVQADAEQDRIQFSVIDTGIGIALEDLKQLFVPFQQVDSALNREYEGTGLGLALVQKLTDLHGGSVDVKSEVGKGSRFTINLPLGQAASDQQTVIESDRKSSISEQVEKSSTPTSEPANRGIILLAENNMANILTIGDYLENYGYQVVVAHDGLEAIEQAEALQPNIILMDIQMPVMDGLEAMRLLRNDPRFASMPIIALTALAMPGDRERCLEAGATEYMSKPVSLRKLLHTINTMLSSEA